jgi:hypothetical protein
MRILIACEESQEVCKAFREKGFEAFSCDILPAGGGHPEWHIQDDVLKHLGDGWDMMIAHPPCTYLANSGGRWLYNKDGSKNIERWEKLKDGAEFFRALLFADIAFIAVENPIPHKYALELIGKKYDQIIQPYQFGHPESKATCLWLKNLPKLNPTDDVKYIWKTLPKRQAQRLHYLPPTEDRAKIRSRTYPGIAKAIAEQWGKYLGGGK